MAVIDLRQHQGGSPYSVGDRIQLPAGEAIVLEVTVLAPGFQQLLLGWVDRPGALPLSIPASELPPQKG